ncbi:hypothetical protein [Thalassotalea insulae]|uniref:hypothetical protein n=1 Tax=Thalassotalea insulae TaxID=2056778 RepID=UPI0024E18558|nr:hypothetical protein [Thalassotalea insulae]
MSKSDDVQEELPRNAIAISAFPPSVVAVCCAERASKSDDVLRVNFFDDCIGQ